MIKSSHGPKETMERLEAEVKAKGLTVLPESIMREGPRRLDCPCGRPSS